MRSQFSSQTLAEIFRDLYLSERSGVLVLSRQEQEKRVYFDRGMILFAESSLAEEDLGRMMVRDGQLSAGALAEARRSLNGSTATPELARTLVHRELIGRATLAQAVRAVVGTVVESVFSWQGGSARFKEGPQVEGVLETDILATIDAILDGIGCMGGFEPIDEALRGLDNRLRVRTPTPIPLERLSLSAAHGFILSRVDGNTSLNEIISILPPGEDENAVRFVFGLLVMGVLEHDPPVGNGLFKVADIVRDHADRQQMETLQEQTIRQTYQRVRVQNPHEILGVEPSASLSEIETAYQEAKQQFNRDKMLPRVRERFRTELTLIESRLIESYLTLTQATRPDSRRATEEKPAENIEIQDLTMRMEMDKAKSKLVLEEANRAADLQFAKARKYMREGDFYNAIQYGKLAISYNHSDARYYFLLAECQVRNPDGRWQRLAEENFSKATQLDPWNAEYWLSLGRFYKQRGLKIRAKKQFEEALKLLPSNADVMRELAELG